MAPARTFPQKNGEKGLGHGRPIDSVLRGWRREVMEYAVFRLAVEYLPHTGYGAIVERG